MRHLSLLRSLLLAVIFGPASGVQAAGLLAPTDQTLPPLRITDHLVSATIRDGVALTTVTQTFHNDTSRRLEATYVFPLPEAADLTDFQMTFNGKMVQGRVLPAEEAARIYESIVRQSRDPGLIEFIGRRLLQMRVFPIEPQSDTTIQVRYQQICRPVGGMTAYHYPLRTRKTSGQAYGTVRFEVDLQTKAPLKGIWSPTHAVEIVRNSDERSARIGYEASKGSLDDDFLLLYDTDASDLGLSVVAHQPKAGEPGHFVLMLTPKQLWPNAEYEPQDVVFVMDTSGSMAGDKIEQARRALKYCVDRLDDRDRFTVVRFSTGFDLLGEGLLAATPEHRKQAKTWIDGFSAAGGTNIADTLQHVLAMKPGDSERPYVVVFLTDGRGNREVDEITKILANAGSVAESVRVFPFGVGHDVNTRLLDQLADDYTGFPTYVQPGEDLELVLGDFFGVVSRPVLTNLRLALPDVGVTERFPATLGDLYHGQQLVIAGRYARAADGPITLRATRGGKDVEYVWPRTSFASSAEADYVPSVWAGRKIAYLIDQIRKHGESSEMIEEVVALSQQYGIQTPYSSWLVDPERMGTVAGVPIRRQGGGAPAAAARERFRGVAGRTAAADAAPGLGSVSYGDEHSEVDFFAASKSVTAEAGATANLVARKNAALRASTSVDEGRLDEASLARRRLGERWYVRVGGVLVDETLAEETAILTVRFGSDAYFELVRERADLRPVFAAAREVVVVAKANQAVLISDVEGVEEFSGEQREQIGLDQG